jgi:hypothetical protein
MASHFHSTIVTKLGSAVPAGVVQQVRDNVGQAVGVARESPAARPYASHIATAAKDSFVGGLHVIGLVAAAITLAAAIGVALFLPARARDEGSEPEPAPLASPTAEPEYVSD